MADAGVTAIALRFPLETFSTALAEIFPVHANTLALPGLMPMTCPIVAFAMATSLLAGSICQTTILVTLADVLSE